MRDHDPDCRRADPLCDGCKDAVINQLKTAVENELLVKATQHDAFEIAKLRADLANLATVVERLTSDRDTHMEWNKSLGRDLLAQYTALDVLREENRTLRAKVKLASRRIAKQEIDLAAERQERAKLIDLESALNDVLRVLTEDDAGGHCSGCGRCPPMGRLHDCPVTRARALLSPVQKEAP